ncbi:MAG: TauD/TfdA family dioxygenase [Sulfuriferula sp.]
MSISIRQIVSERGYAFIARHKPELKTIDAVSLLGCALTLEGFSAVQELRPHAKSSAPPNTYSGNFGTGEFPMHTDLAHWAVPPRYFALRCIKGAQEVATCVFDGNAMINDIGETSLRRTLVQPRRPLRNGKPLLRLFDYFEGHDAGVLRWDSIFLRPATADSEKTHSLVATYITSVAAQEVVLLSPGDTLIVDNWRMIHRRSPMPAGATDRHIDRVYLGELH